MVQGGGGWRRMALSTAVKGVSGCAQPKGRCEGDVWTRARVVLRRHTAPFPARAIHPFRWLPHLAPRRTVLAHRSQIRAGRWWRRRRRLCVRRRFPLRVGEGSVAVHDRGGAAFGHVVLGGWGLHLDVSNRRHWGQAGCGWRGAGSVGRMAWTATHKRSQPDATWHKVHGLHTTSRTHRRTHARTHLHRRSDLQRGWEG